MNSAEEITPQRTNDSLQNITYCEYITNYMKQTLPREEHFRRLHREATHISSNFQHTNYSNLTDIEDNALRGNKNGCNLKVGKKTRKEIAALMGQFENDTSFPCSSGHDYSPVNNLNLETTRSRFLFLFNSSIAVDEHNDRLDCEDYIGRGVVDNAKKNGQNRHFGIITAATATDSNSTGFGMSSQLFKSCVSEECHPFTFTDNQTDIGEIYPSDAVTSIEPNRSAACSCLSPSKSDVSKKRKLLIKKEPQHRERNFSTKTHARTSIIMKEGSDTYEDKEVKQAAANRHVSEQPAEVLPYLATEELFNTAPALQVSPPYGSSTKLFTGGNEAEMDPVVLVDLETCDAGGGGGVPGGGRGPSARRYSTNSSPPPPTSSSFNGQGTTLGRHGFNSSLASHETPSTSQFYSLHDQSRPLLGASLPTTAAPYTPTSSTFAGSTDITAGVTTPLEQTVSQRRNSRLGRLSILGKSVSSSYPPLTGGGNGSGGLHDVNGGIGIGVDPGGDIGGGRHGGWDSSLDTHRSFSNGDLPRSPPHYGRGIYGSSTPGESLNNILQQQNHYLTPSNGKLSNGSFAGIPFRTSISTPSLLIQDNSVAFAGTGNGNGVGVEPVPNNTPFGSFRNNLELPATNAQTAPTVNSNHFNTNDFSTSSFNILSFNSVGNGGVMSNSRDIFDVDEINEDIMKMAAQRDQLRGAGKHVPGMMGPVLGKEDERLSNRKFTSFKSRNEVVDVNGQFDPNDPLANRSASRSFQNVLDSGSTFIAIGIVQDAPLNYRDGTNSSFSEADRKNSSYLGDGNRWDIMTQSIRRQSRKSSHPMLSNIANGSLNSSTGLGGRGSSPDKFLLFNPDDAKFSVADVREDGTGVEQPRPNRRSKRNSNHPSSHEDVQVLNLQGFMDSSLNASRLNSTSPGNYDSKNKSKRRRNKHLDESASGNLHHSTRRKRRNDRSKGRGGNADDNDDDVALKDLDELDDEMSGLVLGPQIQVKDLLGIPISLEEATELRKMLTGSPASLLPTEWMTQNFQANTKENLPYGLVQKKGGPCGVLACVQAHMMKCLIFGSYASPHTSAASPLRPSPKEWGWALAVAMHEIIWRAGGGKSAVLALPSSFPHFTDPSMGVAGKYTHDGVTETLSLHPFTRSDELLEAVQRHLPVFTRNEAPACVLLLYSVMLTRGLDAVSADMDAGGNYLLNAHGYASQEVVNLLLTGTASTNTFDGDTTLGASGSSCFPPALELDSSSRLTLKGVHQRSDIGLLSLFEHYGSCSVGQHLKTPLYPVWVVCSESHYTVLFSRTASVTADDPPESSFDLYYYDGLALQEDEIRLTIRMGSGAYDDEDEGIDGSVRRLVPPLEHCIRTKWSGASVQWNGTDPLL